MYHLYVDTQLRRIYVTNYIMQQHADKMQTHVPLKGYKHLFGRLTAFRLWKHPHFYKPATYVYSSGEMFKNKDSMLRASEGALDDRYISPYKGNTEELVVQAVDNIYDHSNSEGTWNRTFIRDTSPWHLRLANWPESHILSEPHEGEGDRQAETAEGCQVYSDSNRPDSCSMYCPSIM
jgi:hypothetical protein